MGRPTGRQLVSYAMTLRGTAPGHVRENVNRFTRWYYGNDTAASWCLIFVCYCFEHFKALDLLGGKIAYVPDLRRRVGEKWHTARAGIATGDPVTYDFDGSGEPGHVGMFVRWLGSGHTRFEAVEGNTGNDQVATRTRNWHDVFGYVKPGLAASGPGHYPGAIHRHTPGKPPMSSAYVRWIQQRLGTHGQQVTVNGDYDDQTAAAVRAFQQNGWLLEDSQVGPLTWKALAR